MSGLYGVSNHDPTFVLNCLDGFVDRNQIHLNELRPDTKVLFVTSKTFLKVHRKRLSKLQITIFAFGSSIYLKELGIKFLDSDKKLTKRHFRDCVRRDQAIKIKVKKIDLPKIYLEKVKPSIIKHVVTELYKIQDKEVRSTVKQKVFLGFTLTQDPDALEDTLISLSVKPSLVTKFLSGLDRDILRNTLLAVFDSHKLGVTQAAKKHGISSYDIRYILSQKDNEVKS